MSTPLSDVVLRVGIEEGFRSPMPDWATTLAEIIVGRHLFERSLSYGADMSIKPAVFTSWSSDPTSVAWRFEIREDIVFGDGVPVDAESIAWNLVERFPRLAAANTCIGSVQIEGVRRLAVRLSKPSAGFIDQLASFRASLVSPNFNKNDPLQPRAGSGPFELESVEENGTITIRRTGGSRNRAGFPERVIFIPFPDGNALWEAIVAGDLDVIYEVPYRHIRDASSRAGIIIDLVDSLSVNMLLFNGRRSPFAEPLARRAVAKALNPRELIERATEGVGIAPSCALLPPSHPFYPDRLEVPAPWERSGTDDGRPSFDGLSFRLLAQRAYNPRWLDLMARQLAARGIRCEVDRLPMLALLGRLSAGSFDAALIGMGGGPDPDPVFRTLFHSRSLTNYGGFANRTYDRLIDRAAANHSSERRRECYRRAIEILHVQCPAVFVRHGLSVVAHSPRLKGLVAYPDNYLRLGNARFI